MRRPPQHLGGPPQYPGALSQAIAPLPGSNPNLRPLPGVLKQQIKDADPAPPPGQPGRLNMRNAVRAMATEAASHVVAAGIKAGIDAASGAKPSALGDFATSVGVKVVPHLQALTLGAGAIQAKHGRPALVAAVKQQLGAVPDAKAKFMPASFALQADNVDNGDTDHPLATLWNAGGAHAHLYADPGRPQPYRDGDAARAFPPAPQQGGRRRGRTRRKTRRNRRGRRRTRRRSQA